MAVGSCDLSQTEKAKLLATLESGINVAPWINVALEKSGKKNKRRPIYTSWVNQITKNGLSY